MAMALLSDMRRIRGIEMLEGLVEASRSVCDKWQTFIESDEVEIEIDSEEDAEEQQQAGGDGAKKKRTIVHSPLTKLERQANAPQEDRVQFVQGGHTRHRLCCGLRRWGESRCVGAGSGPVASLTLSRLFLLCCLYFFCLFVLSGDFLRENWSDGDLVLMNSTCYSPALMESLSSQAELLRPGAIVVSLTKALKSNKFQLLSKKKYQMSWSDTLNKRSNVALRSSRCSHRNPSAHSCDTLHPFLFCLRWFRGAATAYVQKRL